MHRAQPTANKLLTKKWHEQQHEIHQKRLREMKPTYNISEPKQYRHLYTKPKRVQMLEGKSYPAPLHPSAERYTEIERENRILLEKMTSILQNPRTSQMWQGAPASAPTTSPGAGGTARTTRMAGGR